MKSTKQRVHVLTGRCDETIIRTMYTDEAGKTYVKTNGKFEHVKYAGEHCGWGRNGWYEFPVYSAYHGDWC